MSVYNVAFRGGMPIGSLICGAMIPKFGVNAVLTVNGMLLVLTGIYFTFGHKRVIHL